MLKKAFTVLSIFLPVCQFAAWEEWTYVKTSLNDPSKIVHNCTHSFDVQVEFSWLIYDVWVLLYPAHIEMIASSTDWRNIIIHWILNVKMLTKRQIELVVFTNPTDPIFVLTFYFLCSSMMFKQKYSFRYEKGMFYAPTFLIFFPLKCGHIPH